MNSRTVEREGSVFMLLHNVSSGQVELYRGLRSVVVQFEQIHHGNTETRRKNK
jgi:hypothetical protein